MILDQKLKSSIESVLTERIIKIHSVSGGCISDSQKIITESGNKFFLKINQNQPEDMFLKESNGLKELKKSEAIRVPYVIHTESSFILLEDITSGIRKKTFFEDFGRKFADLHRYKGSYYGFYENNYIGSTPQINIPENDEGANWIDFYMNKRILFQLKLAEKNDLADSLLKSLIYKLENKVSDLFSGSETSPSLLHGDLWGGNYIIDENGDSCLIDPAVYYGDREADLAMTKLFGGFNEEFYESYRESYPLADGYEYRENVYKLYHVLNHLNLFGSGYYSQCISLLKYYF